MSTSPSDPAGYPQQPAGPLSGRAVPLVIGLVIGLVVGAGALGLAWMLSGSGGSDPDAEADAKAVCGVIERTRVPENAKAMEDIPLEEFRRWAVTEVGPSIAKRDPELKPLADAMRDIYPAIQRFDLEKANDAIDRVKEICADL